MQKNWLWLTQDVISNCKNRVVCHGKIFDHYGFQIAINGSLEAVHLNQQVMVNRILCCKNRVVSYTR